MKQISNKTNIINDAVAACKSLTVVLMVFGLVVNLLTLALPIYSLQVLDRVISSNSVDTLIMLTLVVTLALVFLNLIQSLRSGVLIKAGDWLDRRIAPLLFTEGISAQLLKPAMNASQYLRDLNSIKNFLVGTGFVSILDVPWAFIFIGVLFYIHPMYGIVSLAGSVILIILAVINEYATRAALKGSNEYYVKSNSYTDTAARNIEAIEAMGMKNAITKYWHQYADRYNALQQLASSKSNVISGISKGLRMLFQVIITGAGGYLVLQGELTVGAIIAGAILVGRALAPFDAAIASWKGLVAARTSYSRLEGSLKNQTEKEEAMQLPKPTGKLLVEGISFAYEGMKKPILRKIHFTATPGEVITIIGPNGAGKSTLVKLILGLYKPVSGSVRLDNADIYQWNRYDLGQHVGYLPQDIELFDGTVKANIARMHDKPDANKVVAAAKLAGAHEFILHLPQGYETEIGSLGSKLSAGQRQRIALARVFYGDPKLIVLDEPNSNLDYEGEMALAQAFTNAKKQNITTIVVSHRKAVIDKVDKILLLKNGNQIAFGPKKEVLKKL